MSSVSAVPPYSFLQQVEKESLHFIGDDAESQRGHPAVPRTVPALTVEPWALHYRLWPPYFVESSGSLGVFKEGGNCGRYKVVC